MSNTGITINWDSIQRRTDKALTRRSIGNKKGARTEWSREEIYNLLKGIQKLGLDFEAILKDERFAPHFISTRTAKDLKAQYKQVEIYRLQHPLKSEPVQGMYHVELSDEEKDLINAEMERDVDDTTNRFVKLLQTYDFHPCRTVDHLRAYIKNKHKREARKRKHSERMLRRSEKEGLPKPPAKKKKRKEHQVLDLS